MDDLAPSVFSSVPANGDTDISIFTDFTITFSEPMDQTSVESAFSWTDGTDTWTVGDCVNKLGNKQGDWNDYGNMVSFTPDIDIKPSVIPRYSISDYSFSIEATATDLAGNQLTAAYTVSFTTSADIDAPKIEYSQSQNTVSYDQDYTVIAYISDQWGNVSAASLFYQGVGDLTPTRNIIMTNTLADKYTATIPAQLAIGTIYYYIEATDDFNNIARNPVNYTNQSQLFNVSVIDGVKPVISHVQETEQNLFYPIEIWAVVTDEISLGQVELFYHPVDAPTGTFNNITMQNNTVGSATTFNCTIPAQSNIGSVLYNITATDTSGNFNSTTFFTIEIIDRTLPLINSVVPTHMENKTRVLVQANVTDDMEVNEVILYFKISGSDHWVSRTMVNTGGDIYSFTIPAQPKSGNVTINYYVNATDTSGNPASTLTENDAFVIEVIGEGEDLTLYYILGIILAILMVVLVILVIRKFSKPDEPDLDYETNLSNEPRTAIDEPLETPYEADSFESSDTAETSMEVEEFPKEDSISDSGTPPSPESDE